MQKNWRRSTMLLVCLLGFAVLAMADDPFTDAGTKTHDLYVSTAWLVDLGIIAIAGLTFYFSERGRGFAIFGALLALVIYNNASVIAKWFTAAAS